MQQQRRWLGLAGQCTRDLGAGLCPGSIGGTIYLRATDTGAASTCTAACLKVWPAVPASGSPSASGGAKSADLSSIKDTDGGYGY